MFILVQGCNDGFDGRLRARRYFSNAVARRIEVLDQDDDPPEVDREVHGKVVGTMPDPDRIGRRSFAELKEDSCIRILADVDTQDAAASRALEDAKNFAAEKAGELAQAQLELQSVTKSHEALKASHDATAAELTRVTEQAAAASASASSALSDAKIELDMVTEENKSLLARVKELEAKLAAQPVDGAANTAAPADKAETKAGKNGK